MDAAPRWHPPRIFFAARLGGRVRKVPLDAGFSCPNRDGTIGRAGCSFCNAAGSGTGRHALGQSLAAQWAALVPRALAREPRAKLLAYLQAYSNTHASPQRLRAVLAETAALPGVAGLCLGTRSDCLDVGAGEARLDVLAGVLRLGLPFVQLDLGLQSADDAVLSRAGRGHDAACFAAAVSAAASRGVFVCAHLMFGLPGAGPEDLSRSVDFLNTLPIAAVKFHNTLVCRGARLAGLWEAGTFVPARREEYIEALIAALERLRPDVCVQRLFADAAPGELLAPTWAADKAAALDALRREMIRRNTWQGRAAFSPLALPAWT
ncbi:MAG: TIGR01212 family radical SAM protein [Desulfovibrionaceae bacterium CG1_02_65_16]|nr:MAG: TIGR01212 family radical SAM protein [Desulfovibrionaceae bacterium CG1_02_65_16]